MLRKYKAPCLVRPLGWRLGALRRAVNFEDNTTAKDNRDLREAHPGTQHGNREKPKSNEIGSLRLSLCPNISAPSHHLCTAEHQSWSLIVPFLDSNAGQACF